MLYVSRNINNNEAIPDKYYIYKDTDFTTILKTVLLPSDFTRRGEDPNSTYEVNIDGTMAIISLSKYRDLQTGFHSDYIKKYFGL